MSRITEIKCDRCGKTIENEDEAIRIRFVRETKVLTTTTAYDVCFDCCRAIANDIENYYEDDSDKESNTDSISCNSIKGYIDTLTDMITGEGKYIVSPSGEEGLAISKAIELFKKELKITKSLNQPNCVEEIVIDKLKEYLKDKKNVILTDDVIQVCIDSVKKDCPNCERRRQSYNRGFNAGCEE